MEKIKKCFVVPIFNGHIMIQERAIDGTWGLFGGHRTGNENTVDCIKREFFEETGIPLNPLFLGVPAEFGDNKIFPYAPGEKLMKVIPNIETKGFAWVLPEDLEDLSLTDSFEDYLDDFVPFIVSCMEDL